MLEKIFEDGKVIQKIQYWRKFLKGESRIKNIVLEKISKPEKQFQISFLRKPAKNSSAAGLCQKSRFSLLIKEAILSFPKTQILTINSRLPQTFFIIFHIAITIQSNRMRQQLQQFSRCIYIPVGDTRFPTFFVFGVCDK